MFKAFRNQFPLNHEVSSRDKDSKNFEKLEINHKKLSKNQSPEELQLPKTILPIHYDVIICPEVQEPFNFNGSVDIELFAKQETQQIILNMVNLDIESIILWVSVGCFLFSWNSLEYETTRAPLNAVTYNYI